MPRRVPGGGTPQHLLAHQLNPAMSRRSDIEKPMCVVIRSSGTGTGLLDAIPLYRSLDGGGRLTRRPFRRPFRVPVADSIFAYEQGDVVSVTQERADGVSDR